MDKKMVPEVRFKGFTADWEQRKLDKILSESLSPGTNGLKSNKLSVKLWGKGVVKKPEIYKGSSSTKYYKRHSGQIIYGKLDFLHGAFGIIPAELNGYESTIDAPAFDVHGEFNSNFLLDIFVQKSFYLKKGIIANGSRKAKRINEETFLNMSVSLPKKREQDKVNELIKKTSDLITLQQRQLDLYKKLKKGLLQKLFPKNGKRVPEVRFVNFSEDWEEYKLSDLSTVSTGKAFSSSDFNENGKYLVITNKNISNDSKSNSFKTDRIDISDTKTIQKYNLDGKNILVTMDGVNLGKTGLFSNKNAVLAQRVGRIQSNQFEFVYQITSSNRFLSEMRKLSVGNAIKHISLKQISNYINLVPKSVMEQRYIGILLKNIDDTSITQNKKIKELKTLKKYLLQKLFI